MLSSIRLNLFIFSLIGIPVDLYSSGSCMGELFLIGSLLTWEIGTYVIYGNMIPYNVYKINNTILVGTAHSNKYKTLSKDIQEIVEKNDNFYHEISSVQIEHKKEHSGLDRKNKSLETFMIDKIKEGSVELTGDVVKIKSLYFRSSYFYSSSFLNELKKTKLFEKRNIEEDFFLIRFLLFAFDSLDSIDQYPIFLGKNNLQLDKLAELTEKEEVNDARRECDSLIENKMEKLPKFLNECYLFFLSSTSNEMKWIDIYLVDMVSSFFNFESDKIILDKRNKFWLPKIKESINKNLKTSVFVGNCHLRGLIEELKKDYQIEKWNYFIRKFE